ncbi:MAG: hypothetical protein KDD64_04305 [Bdellovibrionales bacterium]|nr:hypothetical protein [Bdellovibrionales bacterium]
MRFGLLANVSAVGAQSTSSPSFAASQAASNAAIAAPLAAQAANASQTSKVLASERAISTTEKKADGLFDSKNDPEGEGAAGEAAQEVEGKRLLAVA